MNNCQCIREQISVYLDNMLDGQELIEFTKHIDNCPNCKNQLEIMQLIINSTNAIEEVELPSSFSSSLRKRLENENETKTNYEKAISYNNKNNWYKNWRIYSAIAAIVLIVIALNSNILETITRQYYSGSSQNSIMDMDKEAYSIEESKSEEISKNKIAKDELMDAKEAEILEEPRQFSITENEPVKEEVNNDDVQLSIMRKDVGDRLTDRSLEPENSFVDPATVKRTNSKMVMKKVLVNTIAQNLDKVILELENNSELDYIVNYYINDEILTININKEKSDEFIKFLEEINVPRDKRIITNDVTEDYMEFIAKHEDLINKLNEIESNGELEELDNIRNEITELEGEIDTIMFYIDKVAFVITTEPIIKSN